MATGQDDTVPALVHKVRTLTARVISLEGDLAKARVDSMKIELLRATTIQGLNWKVGQLEKELPRWWEKPQFVVSVTVMVTIWAVLRMVSISI
jgi:hypothetical protein